MEEDSCSMSLIFLMSEFEKEKVAGNSSQTLYEKWRRVLGETRYMKQIALNITPGQLSPTA